MDAALVCKGVGTHDGLVRLHHHATVVTDHAAGGVNVHRADAGPQAIHLVLTAEHKQMRTGGGGEGCVAQTAACPASPASYAKWVLLNCAACASLALGVLLPVKLHQTVHILRGRSFLHPVSPTCTLPLTL